ncbi:MAG: bifunctional phosphoribosylaminoimidazolecarboxamide formyltransferase/IMP cyclohydrolase [Pseudomonadota bacterium]|nr:bifunctional phosphoribosylaminoimidazolecarboxamide formyltransferase/IMP cyclohydrolase [Pseudomonadota bacterium]
MSAPIRRALLSVSEKSGIAEFAASLAELGVELISTGGTAEALAAAGLMVRDVGDVTGFPEIMAGRVKTLHPKIHGGLLARRGNSDDQRTLERHAIGAIDLLVVSLYPFEAALQRKLGFAEMIELIDIGGPAMIRSAAKNFADVTVVVDPKDYRALIEHMKAHAGGTAAEFRLGLAAKAFARTAAYDAAIAGWFGSETGEPEPKFLSLGGTLIHTLRYGENPHQRAAFYAVDHAGPSIAAARQVQGKELSYNNITDADAALACVAEFDPAQAAACVIVKHANPCGAALAATPVEAFRSALAGDRVSAFGGIVALNRTLDEETAVEIARLYTEVVVAPDACEAALAAMAEKKNLRLLLTGGLPVAGNSTVRSVTGGFLVQSPDDRVFVEGEWRAVTRRQPTAAEEADLTFAFTVAKHVKSNAIVLARDGATVGIGAGQMSRVDASRIAVRKAEEAATALGAPRSPAVGAVVASDAFFPLPDGLLIAIDAGATAVIQPGGSIRDDEVIAAADAAGVAMIFTGIRHFRH